MPGTTPFGNSIVEEMCKAALTGEKLGRGPSTDFLAVSFSSTDYVGHAFGPNSMEAEDTYLRLDRTLADLLTALDAGIGKGNYLVPGGRGSKTVSKKYFIRPAFSAP